MAQKPGYTYPFKNADHQLKSYVWNKGRTIDGFDPNVWRHDKCGHVIKWSDHGNRSSKHGWEIDHIYPKALGGGDELSNLQPLHWENNVDKGDSTNWSCPVRRVA